MGLIIRIEGLDYKSDEYIAAEKFKRLIENSAPQGCLGELLLYVGATLYGQKVKDIDLFVIGEIRNCFLELDFIDDLGNNVKKEVEIRSICTVIEVKSHSIGGVFRKGTDFYVKYGDRVHSATEQSNAQKISAMNFFKKMFTSSPYITNVIWFTEITKKELMRLVSVQSKEMYTNLLNDTFSMKDFIQLLVRQKQPYLNNKGKNYIFESINRAEQINDFQNAFDFFSQVKKTSGELTRRRVEEITDLVLKDTLDFELNSKLSIIRGRAGTGKTIGLIRFAIKTIDEHGARSLILTYNKALVIDIRRLLSLAEIPDMFNEKSLTIRTIHSYFYELINLVLYNGRLSLIAFLDNYECEITKLLTYITDENGMLEMILEICRGSYSLDWDYVFIDEAQDWTDTEMEIVAKLFGLNHIVIADGGSQFVRNINVCDWSKIKEKENKKLKICLRQKRNLIKFINHFSERLYHFSNSILGYEKSVGGKIIIVENESKVLHVVKQELISLRKEGNVPYDMLMLVSSPLVNKENSEFILKKEYEMNEILIWDGTNPQSKLDCFIENEQVRVLQYESSRGLEGWTVVCLNFDEYLEIKEREFVCEKSESVILDTIEDRRKKFILNWAVLPLTRAIDTLVITVKNPNSVYAKLLKDISSNYKDYIYWVN